MSHSLWAMPALDSSQKARQARVPCFASISSLGQEHPVISDYQAA
jgi:hypothetical protein